MDPATVVGVVLVGLACFALGILWAGDHFERSMDQLLDTHEWDTEKPLSVRRDVYDQEREER